MLLVTIFFYINPGGFSRICIIAILVILFGPHSIQSLAPRDVGGQKRLVIW